MSCMMIVADVNGLKREIRQVGVMHQGMKSKQRKSTNKSSIPEDHF